MLTMSSASMHLAMLVVLQPQQILEGSSGIPCNLCFSAGQCPCTQGVPSQGSGHSSGGPVRTRQETGQTPGLVRYVTRNLLRLLYASPA